jgi:PPP family 3-phenylpropionic acid transporter
MFFFQGPINGASDSMVIENGVEFASVRLWGAIGYALAVFAGGRIGDNFGLGNIFYIYAAAYLIGAVLVTRVSAKPHEAEKNEDIHTKNEKIGYRDLLADRKAVRLILCGVLICGSNVANNTYFSFLYLDGGGTMSGVGTAFLLMVGCEAPFMALAPFLSKKITREKAILLAAILQAARFLWYGTGPSALMLTATFFLQGIVNGILLVEYVKYISSVVESRLIGIAVAAYYAISSHIGTILCNFFGGIAMDYFGSTGVYTLFGILNFIGVVMFVLCGLHKSENKVEKRY